jgi:hypothetical protein
MIHSFSFIEAVVVKVVDMEMVVEVAWRRYMRMLETSVFGKFAELKKSTEQRQVEKLQGCDNGLVNEVPRRTWVRSV